MRVGRALEGRPKTFMRQLVMSQRKRRDLSDGNPAGPSGHILTPDTRPPPREGESRELP